MTKFLGIIQARMDSSRLPGKVMLKILGKPVIWHIYNRLKTCNNIDQICIATSINPLDDKIENFSINENIPIFRGSEEKLVERLVGAATKFNADAIVRITADCPLVDPKIVDHLITMYQETPNIDFVSNTIQRTFPDGLDVEVIRTKFLEKLSSKIRDSQSWFIMHIIENQKQYACLNYKNKVNLSKLRWTMDYEEDYKFIKAVYEELYDEKKTFYMDDILSLLTRKPSISKINKKYPADTSTTAYLKQKNSNYKI